ncbi:cytochrome C oxidase subunit III [Lutibacter sp. HS1-25]|uniref:cbb3-type cytochrome c oxidase N-terminal domain-containing protein n=1 Tax=Lutibacter sp. HS1-25 TaxID=2485000 RepID=UPI001012FC54|nr:cbb3-type cytochrome c oxidase N-terminal domain-containing protein [Lutibacter sp. HS1-25]RXP47079.1 cytochrome C oxidase subunit III [Lutibacter sp. HS1-25]
MNKNSEKISGWKRFMKSMTKAHDLGTEEDILLDHDYDGIKELDNVLPPWWLYGFYITIAISAFYVFQVLTNPDDYNQANEYSIAVAEGKAEVEAYKAANPQLFDDSNIVALTDEASIAKGKALFTEKTCFACHLADLGGSIGPNLTDNTWILGGGVKNIFNTISKGGRPGKGMIAWESTISRDERIQLASYIISMQGTTPANPKAAEGDIIWPEVTEEAAVE